MIAKKTVLIQLLALCLLCCAQKTAAEELRLHFINAGEGDSILIEAGEKEKKWALIDTGNLITGHNVARYLVRTGVSRLDYLILTHPDMDHTGGAFLVAQMFEVSAIFDNGDDIQKMSGKSDYFRWYHDLVRTSKSYKVLKRGDILPLANAKLEILWPDPKPPADSWNANSLVIMVKYGGFSALLAGDLNFEGEKRMMEKYNLPKVNVLKAGHHGARDASSSEMLRQVAPEVVIISVNSGNVRGYPSEATVSRIEKTGAKIYRTDMDGNILAEVEKDGPYHITTSHK